jgi:hypothetical protein
MFACRERLAPFNSRLSGRSPIRAIALILTLVCGKTGQVNTPAGRRVLAELVNEFAAVRVSLDVSGNGPRLLVEDLEGGEQVFLCPLELASFTLATPEDREEWLRVGNYRGERRGREQQP